MGLIDSFVLKVRRAEEPQYRLLKRLIRAIVNPQAPRIPRVLKPIGRFFYELHYMAIIVARSAWTFFYCQPLFQSRCATAGKNLRLAGLPYVDGHLELHVGDDVSLGGNLTFLSGSVFDRPQLVLKDRCSVGWNTTITVNQEIVIEEDVMISYDCRISDSDGHPRDAQLRAQHKPPDPGEVKPVHIHRYAWIGNGAHIMKGVTIGEGAIIGANSVVISDIPAYSVAMGNPAEVYFKNIDRKSRGN